MIELTPPKGVSHNFHNILFCIDLHFHSHLAQHFTDCRSTVAFLVGESSHTIEPAASLTESSEYSHHREEVRTMGEVAVEGHQRRLPYVNFPLVGIELGNACPGCHQHVHNRKVCLNGCRIQAIHASPSEHGSCHQEWYGRTPVPFQVQVRGAVFLPCPHLEYHLRAEGPIPIGGEKIPVSKHLVGNFHPEF